MYRLQSPGCHCLKGDCFLTKLFKKNTAMACFLPVDAAIISVGMYMFKYNRELEKLREMVKKNII